MTLLDDVAQKLLMATAVSYNTSASACEKGRQQKASIGLLREMLNHLLVPSIVSHNTFCSSPDKGTP